MGNRTDFCIDMFAFTIHSPAWETAPISASICSPSTRSPAWNRTDIGTSDHLGITHGRKTVLPLRNPCDSDPFWSQLTINVRLHDAVSVRAIAYEETYFALFLSTAERRLTADHLGKIFCTRLRSRMGGIFRSLFIYRRASAYCRPFGQDFLYASTIEHGRHLSLSFYLPPSVGFLPTIWTRFSVRVYDQAWEAPFALFLSTAERRLTRAIFGTQSRSSYELK